MKFSIVGSLLAVMTITTAAGAQTAPQDGFWRHGSQLKPDLIGAENDPHYSQKQECDILNRWRSRRIDKVRDTIVRTDEIQYVLALDVGANATSCLRFDLMNACDSQEKADRVVVKFFAVQNNGLYRENATYQLSGVCKESSDSADVRLITTTSGLQFEKVRRFEATTGWEEVKRER